ncbi:hypothetical protein AB0K09_07645 [Streptomyces sp. NPDC049577]|uniref:hypothetical protein n=1 Tax=Streptomyces sp. NPDC049577 TaxID=3155153 RepID=UPI003432CFE0
MATAVLLPGHHHPGDAPPVRIVTPPTLAGGTYRLTADTARLRREGLSVDAAVPDGATSVLARYQRANAPSGTLSLSALYGDPGDPAAVLDGMFQDFRSPTRRETFHPAGASGPAIECEVVRMDDSTFAPACAWAEKTDAALLIEADPSRRNATSVDAAAFAKLTARIHDDVRKPG